MLDNDRGTIALFADWESLKQGLQEKHKVDADIPLLLDAIEEFGQLGIARAYADWTREPLRADALLFDKRRIKTVHVGASEEHSRTANSANVRLAAEAVDLSHRHNQLQTFVLISGDSDLSYVADVLKRNQRRVVYVGLVGRVSSEMGQAVDEVMYYDQDLVSLTAKESDSAPPRMSGKVDFATACSWAEDLLRQSKGQGLSLSQLEHVMRHLYAFNPKDLELSFNDFIKKMQQEGRLKLNKVNDKLHVFLPGNQASAKSAAKKQASQPAVDSNPAVAQQSQELQWLIAIVRAAPKPLPFQHVAQELKQRHNVTVDKALQAKIAAAQKQQLVKMMKNKDNQWYIGKGAKL